MGDHGTYQSSDEDGVKGPSLQETQQRSRVRIRLPANLGDTDSEEEEEEDDDEEDEESLRLTVPPSGSHKSTTV